MHASLVWVPLALAAVASAQSPGSAPNEGARKGRFELRHEVEVKLPAGAKTLSMWMALPQEDAIDKVSDLKIESPYPTRVTKDNEGNRVLYIEGKAPFEPAFKVVTTFGLERLEDRHLPDAKATRALNAEEKKAHAHFLASTQYIVIDDGIKKLATEIVGDDRNPISAGKKIYDWVLANIDYWVKDPANKKASPTGSSEYCLSSKTGNCADFHSLYSALARAADIPTKPIYGAFLKKELDGQDVDQSFHCWLEIWAPNLGWIPLDVAAADVFVGEVPINKDNETLMRRATAAGYHGPDPKMVEYYFGNLEERRVTFTVGRELVLDPKPAAGAINTLYKCYVEVDGKPLAEKTDWNRKLTYKELK
jgi:transglutaminase-like putative cysteine protease